MDDQIKFEQAAAMILGIEQHLPNSLHISMTHIGIYHDNLDKIEIATGHDLGHFRIPDTDLRPTTVTRMDEGHSDRYRLRRTVRFVKVPTGKYHCPRSLFLIRLQGLVNFLQMQLAPKEQSTGKTIGF